MRLEERGDDVMQGFRMWTRISETVVGGPGLKGQGRSGAETQTAGPMLGRGPALRVERVSKEYPGGSQILSGLDFEVARGERVAVVGKSGCGKSTLLNIVAGLTACTDGAVRINGDVLRGKAVGVGYMTQSETLLPWRTAFGNVELPLVIAGFTREERRERVEEWLALVGLEGRERYYPSKLSGGMRRRVALARCLISQPELVLLDEPFSALDAQLRIAMHDLVEEALYRVQSALVLVTHDLQEAVLLADRVLVLSGSPAKVAAEVRVPFGRPRKIDEIRFADEFVALERKLWESL